MIQGFRLFLLFVIFLIRSNVFAQDQIFLRNEDGLLDCYILHVNDSIIVFRTLDPNDKHEYEIPYADTYGFLLEDVDRLNALSNYSMYQLQFHHAKKKRRPVFSVNNGLIFKLKNDTSFLPHRGKITGITSDSIQLEMKRKFHIVRLSFAIRDIEMFGYTTNWTELATLIAIPSSSLNEGALQFYRQLTLSKGWVWETTKIPEQEVPYSEMKKKFRPGQLLKLPKSVSKKNRPDN
jgi:hypothetical protein